MTGVRQASSKRRIVGAITAYADASPRAVHLRQKPQLAMRPIARESPRTAGSAPQVAHRKANNRGGVCTWSAAAAPNEEAAIPDAG
jgi:hypothetical protein